MKNVLLTMAAAAVLCVALIPSPGAADGEKMPGIDGSQAYDVIIGLQEMGVEQPETQYLDDGFQYTSGSYQIGGVTIMYDIMANSSHEICTATFNMAGGDNGFLAWVGSLPYAAADKDQAQAFISAHLSGEDASATIGDAVWEIYPYPDGGAMLRVHDVDSEAYFNSLF